MSNKSVSSIRILNWNVRNPSLQRAQSQIEMISRNSFDCIILTELKDSNGGHFIADALQKFGYHVVFLAQGCSDYLALIAVRGYTVQPLQLGDVSQTHRCPAAHITLPHESLLLIGAYVPSRGPQAKRNVEKRLFQRNLAKSINNLTKQSVYDQIIVGGDLNIVERDHKPPHHVFGEWEYEFYESFSGAGLIDAFRVMKPNMIDHSWFGLSGDGYRLDHFFVSSTLCERLQRCYYDHEFRKSGLSDHSAMILEVSIGEDGGA